MPVYAAGQIRVGRQPKDRQGDRADDPGVVPAARRRGDRMKRREFITLLGGAATAWPLAARGQQTKRVGVLMGGPATDSIRQAYVAAFGHALRQLGWIERQNLRVDVRW